MSRSFDAVYELERQQRQAMFDARVRATTEPFYRRYMEQYEQMVKAGYEEFILDEIKMLRHDLDEIRENLSNDPAYARTVSQRVGRYISNMHGLGRAAQQQAELNERLRKDEIKRAIEESQANLLNVYYDEIKALRNPITIELAKQELNAIKQTMLNKKFSSKLDADQYVSTLKSQIKEVVSKAESKAIDRKKKQQEEKEKEGMLAQVEELKNSLKAEKLEDENRKSQLIFELESLQTRVEAASAASTELVQTMEKLTEKVDDAVITETVRKEVVKSIVKQLRSQEFRVEQPVVISQGGKDYVKVVAKKPSGKTAECRIDLNGKIQYKFDSYEGMTCIKDIEKFNIDLKDIYSVTLSDERVLWENPNKISKDERPIGNEGRRNL